MMIELEKKKNQRSGAIGASSKENNRDAHSNKDQRKSPAFSLFGKKSAIEELKKKMGPGVE
ncbi:MAG: hypothetical protein ACREBU_07900, partial [Nitrososphaera sp.]